jgi:hypothetical protein
MWGANHQPNQMRTMPTHLRTGQVQGQAPQAGVRRQLALPIPTTPPRVDQPQRLLLPRLDNAQLPRPRPPPRHRPSRRPRPRHPLPILQQQQSRHPRQGQGQRSPAKLENTTTTTQPTQQPLARNTREPQSQALKSPHRGTQRPQEGRGPRPTGYAES